MACQMQRISRTDRAGLSTRLEAPFRVSRPYFKYNIVFKRDIPVLGFTLKGFQKFTEVVGLVRGPFARTWVRKCLKKVWSK